MKKDKIKGLGDAIKVVTEFVGIEQCEGCIRRQETLNRLFPFISSKDVAPLTEREIYILDDMEKTRVLKQEYNTELFSAYNTRFVRNVRDYIEPCLCPNLIKKMKESLELLRTTD